MRLVQRRRRGTGGRGGRERLGALELLQLE